LACRPVLGRHLSNNALPSVPNQILRFFAQQLLHPLLHRLAGARPRLGVLSRCKTNLDALNLKSAVRFAPSFSSGFPLDRGVLEGGPLLLSCNLICLPPPSPGRGRRSPLTPSGGISYRGSSSTPRSDEHMDRRIDGLFPSPQPAARRGNRGHRLDQVRAKSATRRSDSFRLAVSRGRSGGRLLVLENCRRPVSAPT